jgi:hypothetical protein
MWCARPRFTARERLKFLIVFVAGLGVVPTSRPSVLVAEQSSNAIGV